MNTFIHAIQDSVQIVNSDSDGGWDDAIMAAFEPHAPDASDAPEASKMSKGALRAQEAKANVAERLAHTQKRGRKRGTLGNAMHRCAITRPAAHPGPGHRIDADVPLVERRRQSVARARQTKADKKKATDRKSSALDGSGMEALMSVATVTTCSDWGGKLDLARDVYRSTLDWVVLVNC